MRSMRAKLSTKKLAKPSNGTAVLDRGDDTTADIHLRWQTNETLPLQIMAERQKTYAGLELYKGLPVTLGIKIPAALKPTLSANVIDNHPLVPGTVYPGGPVFDEIQVDLDAVQHDWIWLTGKLKE